MILSPMLNYLETHILELDAQYAAKGNQAIERLEQENAELKRLIQTNR